MTCRTILAATLVLLAISAVAQVPAKPGPEVAKLNYFVGSWTLDATIGQGPWGAGGKFSSSATTDWLPGEFFIRTQTDFKMPPEVGGEGKSTAITGYDAEQGAYTRDEFNSHGDRVSSKGTLAGDTWTWNSSRNYAGTQVQIRTTVKPLSPTSYNLKIESSIDGTTWMTFMEGKATKK
jgi:hypothetical protein